MFPFRLQVDLKLEKKKQGQKIEIDRELENGDNPASRFEQL